MDWTNEVDVHAHIEETIFYPVLKKAEESRDITLEAYEEHKVVKDLLAKLAAGKPGDQWNAKLTVLKENVDHHVDEEEGELFDKAKNVLTDEQAELFGDEMAARSRPNLWLKLCSPRPLFKLSTMPYHLL